MVFMQEGAMTFDTFEEARDEFHRQFGCDSDDPDIEDAKVERWIEDHGHKILDLPE